MAKEHEVTRREFLRLAGVAGGVIGLGGGLGGILAACGGGTTTTTGGAATTAGSTPTTAGAVTTASTTVASSTTLVAPKKGGSLVIVTPDEGSGVIGIPWQMQSPQGSTASSCVDTLVKVTWDGTVEPNLATSWEIAADGTSITFALQPNAKFHDGTVCDATAVKWNFDQWIQSKLGLTNSWVSADAVDATHVRVNLKAWSNSVLSGMIDGWLGFISPTAFEKNGQKWAEGNLVSTGPYKLTSVNPGVGWTCERNPDWWGGEIYLDAIEFKTVKDYNAMQMMLESGQADIGLTNGGNASVQTALKEKGFVLLGYGQEEPMCLYPDAGNAKSPWADKKVREAVDYALDRESIAALGKGMYIPTYEFVDPRSTLYDASLERKYDPAKAKELLAASAYPDGFETTVWTGGNVFTDPLTVFQQNLADIGIKLNVEVIDIGAGFGMSMKGWENGFMTGPAKSWPGYMQGAANWWTDGIFVSAYRSQELQTIVDQAMAKKDMADMVPYNKQLVKLLSDEVAGYPMFITEYSVGAKASYVHDDGFGDGPVTSWTPAKCWLSK